MSKIINFRLDIGSHTLNLTIKINIDKQREFNPDIILDIVRLKTVNSHATVI